MRFLLALAVLIFPRAGPDTATRTFVAEPECTVKLRMDSSRCPEPVLCDISHALPDPGHSIRKAKASADHKTKRIRIDLEMHRKPGAWPQVIVRTKTTVNLGVLRKGRYVAEIWRGQRLLHAFVLEGR